MPRSVYENLDLGNLKKTQVTVTLADRSAILPLGVVEDVLVRVNGLVFPADFYILEMGNSADSSSILLGRPFLRTARTCIDCHSGTLSMEFDNEKISFNIFDTIKYPDDYNVSSITIVDDIDELVEEHLESETSRAMNSFNESFDEFWDNLEDSSISEVEKLDNSLGIASENVLKEIEELESPNLEVSKSEEVYILSCPMSSELKISTDRMLPSIEKAPNIELKPLPDHLKYAFLGSKEMLPVIISSNLNPEQE
jgi:hypothetical protein